ncbi:Imm21 family immunity protein [Kribbella sp. NPDC006257]|uniref:Imm21 family immunity protein n=1 Tax=Kribbella sp. NPDC006257 TaxID=3156738 RepID=UPI0033A267EB
MGGPLIVVPVSALDHWGGGTQEGIMTGGTGPADDYDRACAVTGWAGVISVGSSAALVLGDEPASTCYLAGERTFVRWLAADSDAEVFGAAEVMLNDPRTEWELCGVWETDGAAVLMDSAEAGTDLGVEYPGGGTPEQAPIDVPAGSWSVLAAARTDEFPWICLVRLVQTTPQSFG